jgi:hypothetical protein
VENTREITRRSKLLDVLKAYPFLEEQIIEIAPPFKNLRNPILRRTVGQLATIEQVAQIGNVDVVDLVNTLRRAAGQSEVADVARALPVAAPALDDPDWIAGSPAFTVDGTRLLADGEVPLEHVNDLLNRLPSDGYILLVTDFEPSPIIEAMQKQGRRVSHKADPDGARNHFTYIGARA